MSAGIIEFDHVWKKFRTGEVHSRLRDAIPAFVARALGRVPQDDALSHEEFWALSDVSFTVRPGEAFGIIGPNGAGKSTILKLLTRIMRPTRGVCRLQGRVGALIEVAAGFHPDLTGRENVYLHGVIMGMPRREITRKFDQIVAFADLSPFIDTPVKRYSSGMQARLGFAVAAHLEPDVLLVDEVLAVGDAAFQAKAYARVKELVTQHIPVVIVSHELDRIAALCSHAVLLERGCVKHLGSARDCIAAYLHGGAHVRQTSAGNAAVAIDNVTLHNDPVGSGATLRVTLECTAATASRTEPESVWMRLRLAQTGEIMHETGTLQLGQALPPHGSFSLTFDLQMNVPPGIYVLETLTWNREIGREVFEGPMSYLEVTGDPFTGIAQLNPRVRLEPTPAGPHGS